MLCDAHCHFFSARFLELLTQGTPAAAARDAAAAVAANLGWDPPGAPEALADRWVDGARSPQVGRAALIASIPGDESSVREAVARHPSRLVGFFMLNPAPGSCASALDRARSGTGTLRAVCLFPAMHRYRAGRRVVADGLRRGRTPHGSAVFVHCGVLTVGVRKKLGLPSRFDLRLGDPLAVARVASAFRRCR